MTPAQNQENVAAVPRVSVVVVSRNRVELLRKCLRSIEGSRGRETFQVIVVDNGSSDGSAQVDGEFPAVQYIRLPKNFGLTKAWNLGWRAADAEYVLFLHDDTEVDAQAIARLADLLDSNSDAGAVCPLLVDGDGHPAPQLGSFPPDGHWRPAQPVGDEMISVGYPRGAAVMMRVFLIKSIRQIDERYGQFGADADLAAQIRRGGKRILLAPDVKVRHQNNRSYSSIERADFRLARAVFMGKYRGFAAGVQARISAVLAPLASFHLGEVKFTISGQKIDGTQE